MKIIVILFEVMLFITKNPQEKTIEALIITEQNIKIIILNNFIMYNLFQYKNKKHLAQTDQKKIEQHSSFIIRHQEFKKAAHENLKSRAEQFLFNQATSERPFTFEDDHHQSWRRHRLYRDVEDESRFQGFKTFRHRPNEDMDKFYTSRERKEMEQRASRKQILVESGVLPREHLSRSQRSQGPYGPKVQFRVSKQDEEYLQPRLRFTNVTDRQRMNESAMNFTEKVEKIYQRFQASKSRLGRTMREDSKRYEAINNAGESKKMRSQSLKRRYSREEQPEESLGGSTKLSQYFEQRGQARRKSKAYFKLSKTMQMFHPDQEKRIQFQELLKSSQFDREKDLSNILSNIHGQSFQKRPIV